MKTFLYELFVELVSAGILKLFGFVIEVVKNNVDEN